MEGSSEPEPPNNGRGSNGPYGANEELEDRGNVDEASGGEVLSRRRRDQKASSHLQDYICYSTIIIEPTLSSLLQRVSSGKPYPIVSYVTCENFLVVHQQHLTAITKVMVPRNFHKVVKDANWGEAMAKKIKALEANEA